MQNSLSPTDMKRSKSQRKVEWTLFWLLFLSYGYFFQGGGWNQNTRFDQVRAIVEEGRLSVNTFHENTGDLVLVDRHFYPNKPPGVALMGVPTYWVLFHLERWLGYRPDSSVNCLHGNLHAVTVFSVSLLSALLGCGLFRLMRVLGPASVTERALLTLGFGFGTLALPWSTLFQAHQVSAALTFLAFVMLVRQRRLAESQVIKPGKSGNVHLDFFAGLLAGASVAVAYNNLPVVLILLIYRFYGPERDRGTERFLLGLAPAALLLMSYHWLCFGDPLASPYRYQNPNFRDESGALFQWPGLGVLYQITFGPYRGIFFTSPLLVLSVAGAWWMWRDRKNRPECLVCAAVVAFYFLLNASFIRWDGGWTAGPRYLIPCLPFLATPLLFLPKKGKMLLLPLLAVSVFFQTVICAVNPAPDREVSNPLFDYCLKHFFHGQLSLNTQSVLALHLPAFEGKPDPPGAEWFSYNLGELVGLRGLWSLLPLMALWALVAWRVHKLCRRAGT